MGWNMNDLTARTKGPLATFRASAYVFVSDGSQHVVFQGFSAAAGGDGHVHELYWHPGGWHLNDLTTAADAPEVTLFPTGYDFSNNGSQHVVYQGFVPGEGDDRHIHELYWNADDGWQHNDLTVAARAPQAMNTPVGHQFNGQRVFYEGVDSHIHGLEWNGDGWGHTDLTATTGAPIALLPPTAYVFGAQVTDHVLYLAPDATVHELWWDASGWHHSNLTLAAGAPPAADTPAGFASNGAFTQHVAYRGTDGHLHALQWTTSGWTHADLTTATGAPLPVAGATPTGYVVDVEQTLHVDYTGTDGNVHELWHDGSGWHHMNLTAATGAPAAITDPSGYYLASERTQHVFYVSGEHHVVELWWAA